MFKIIIEIHYKSVRFKTNAVATNHLIKQGGSGYYGNQYEESRNNFVTAKTESDLAKEIGVDVRTLQNYKKLTELVPEL